MRLLRRKRLWFGFVLLVILTGFGAGLIFSDRFLDGVVRPRLERLAAARLQAEVQFGRLVWEDGGLTLTDLSIRRNQHYRMVLPRLRVVVALGDLLRRRLTSVDLLNPTVEISPSPPSDTETTIPARPPLTVGRLSLRGGRFTYAHSTRPLAVQDLDFVLSGGEEFEFACSGRVLTQTPVPIASRGTGQWRNGVQLSLASLQWQGRGVLRRPVTLSLPAGQGGGRLKLDLDFGRVTRGDVESWLAAFQAADTLPRGWDFAAEEVRVAGDWQPGLLHARLSLGRTYAGSSGVKLPLDSLALETQLKNDRWLGQGSLVLESGATGVFDFEIGNGPPQAELVLTVPDPAALQKPVLGRVVLPVTGSVALKAEMLKKDQGVFLSYALRGGAGGGKPPGAMVDLSALTVDGTLEQYRDGWRIGAEARLTGKPLVKLAGDAQKLHVGLLATSWSRWRRLLPAARQPAWLQDVQNAAGEVTLTRGKSGWSADIALRAALVATEIGKIRDMTFAGRLSGSVGKMNLSSGDLRAQVLHDLFGGGGLQTRFHASQITNGGWNIDIANLDLGPLELMSADGLAGLAGGRLQLRGRVCRGAATAPLEMRLAGRGRASEALWGAWYGELGGLPVDMAIFANWHSPQSRLELIDLKLDVADFATLRGRGELLQSRMSLDAAVKVSDLAKSWDDRGRGLVRELYPLLGDLGLTGGMDTRLVLLGEGEQWHLRGEVNLQKLSVDWPRGRFRAGGLHGNIPLDLKWPVGDLTETLSDHGQLFFDGFSCGPLSLDAGRLQLAVGTNRMVLENALRLSVGGGHLSIDQLQMGYDTGGLQMETRLRLGAIDLHALTSELGMVPMEGSVNADLGHIRYADGVLRSDGEVQIEAFGGGLRLRELQLDPFSLGLPQLQADLDFSGIDLYQLTQTFAFGAINGVVDGEVHGLRLYGATPSHFSARLETRLGGRRNISVKALNNLSILSQGGLSAALSRGIYRFIDFYRYRRIGIHCDLAEDVFTLRGTARPDSRRYLVDGGLLPPKIDIIAPEQPISFREMLLRLKRLDRTGRGS